MPILWRSYGCHRPKEYFRFWNLWIFCNGKCIWEMARSIMVIYLCIAQARSSSWNLGDQASDVDRGSEMIPTSLRCTSWRVQFSWSLLRDSGRNLPNKNMAKRQLKKHITLCSRWSYTTGDVSLPIDTHVWHRRLGQIIYLLVDPSHFSRREQLVG